MKRQYILINSEKLKIPNWSKWIILFLICNIVEIAVYIPIVFIGFRMGIESYTLYQIAWFICTFIVLTLIYDLAPKFKKFFSAMASFYHIILLLGISHETGMISFLITFGIIILYNILLYKNKKN